VSKIFDSGFDERVFGHAGVAKLDEVITKLGHAHNLVVDTERLMKRSKLLGNMATLAGSVEPMHRTIGSLDEEVSAAHAFYNGARVALGGLRHITSLEQRQALEQGIFRLPKPEPGEDPDAFAHVNTVKIMDAGYSGFMYAEAYHQLYEAKIERPICPQVKYDIFARAGFGLPFYMAREVKLICELVDLDKEANHAATQDGQNDWDKAFQEMLDS
jgi:hypothetical protein